MDSVEQRIKQIVLATLKIDGSLYSEELSAGDIPQWDSLATVQLLQNVEMAFEMSFDIADAIAVEDVGDLIDLVRRYATAG